MGSGHGRNTSLLMRRFPDSQIISLDFKEDLCKYVKEHVNEHVICADATSLPLKDKSFDLVVSDQVIEHIENQNELVEELDRVLAEEGYLVCGSVLRKRFTLAYYRNAKGDRVISTEHVREYRSKQEVAQLFNDRFDILGIHTGPFPTSLFLDIYQLLIRIPLFRFGNNDVERHISKYKLPDSPVRKLVDTIIFPMPGYRFICLIAKKKTAN